MTGDGVVADVGAGVGAGEGDGLAGARVLGVEGAGGGDGEVVAIDEAAERCVASANGCDGVAVIDLVAGGDAGDGQFLGCDVRACGSRVVGEYIVACTGAGEGDAGDGDRFGSADVLVGEGPAGAIDAEYVVAEDAGEGSALGVERGVGVAVVDLVLSGDARHRRDAGAVDDEFTNAERRQ